MKAIQVELPDRLAAAAADLVREGWFTSESELIRLALLEFIRRHPFELQEHFQLEDVAWARKLHEQRHAQS
jgi:Arc/MetJ-type ribon-helix-helix transcriptional regulator